MMWAAALGSVLLAQTYPGLEGLPASSQQLARIRIHMAETLEHQPNYTCLETVERSFGAAGSRKLQVEDTVRLEVALVDGNEMFAWPGSKKFEETDLRKLIPTGMFGNGDFALHARSVFLGRGPTFQYMGAEIYAGSPGPLERYDFRVPRLVSGYTIRMERHTGVAGYHGSFWADKNTLDVRRLEVIADDIPAELGVTAAVTRVDSARVAIGTGEFLLPVESELRMTDVNGIESVNHVRFTSCRQYTGESTLTFDDPDTALAGKATPAELPEADLPSDVDLTVSLAQDLDVSTAAVGDMVGGQLNAPVRRKGEVLAPKGAPALCRITRLERHPEYTILGITLVSLETAERTLRVEAKLESVPGLQPVPRNMRVFTGPPSRGEGFIVLAGGRVRLKRGMLMYWRT